MPKQQPSPQEIDRRAGAINAKQYHAMTESRLLKTIQYYRKLIGFSIAIAIGTSVLWLVVNYLNFVTMGTFGSSYGIALVVSIGSLVNALYQYSKKRKAERLLQRWREKK